MKRRDLIKGLATIPVLGAFSYAYSKKQKFEESAIINHKNALNIPEYVPGKSMFSDMSQKLRVGIIGYGGRGSYLLRSAGFVPPKTVDEWKKSALENQNDNRYEDFMNQEDLNIEITGICDVFDIRAEDGLAAAANKNKEGLNGTFNQTAKRYKNYKEMLMADDIDAVIIATSDHWHSQMAIDAAKLGKHVYVEKGMTRTVDETFALRSAVKESGIIFQLGHQGRQTSSYNVAKHLIDNDLIGKINLIEVCTNRNSPNGAWVYDIHPDAKPENIDWEQFIGPTKWHEFSLERFFRWRCWWDYGTGLSGDLLTHEYDAINQILGLGIPHSAVSSGGVYFYKDGREVPDVWQVALEYPERDFTFLYSASLASNKNRGKVIMGHDGYMEVENNLLVYPDRESTKYSDQIKNKTLNPDEPMYTYIPGKSGIDGFSTPTEKYFASRGLLYTYQNGKRVDTAHLHIKEWLQGIRSKTQPSCNIDQGFEEAITAHMATISYLENRKVFWDKENEKVI